MKWWRDEADFLLSVPSWLFSFNSENGRNSKFFWFINERVILFIRFNSLIWGKIALANHRQGICDLDGVGFFVCVFFWSPGVDFFLTFLPPYSERRLGAQAEVPRHLALHEEHLAAGRTSWLVPGGHAERLGRRSFVGSLFLLVSTSSYFCLKRHNIIVHACLLTTCFFLFCFLNKL